MEYDHDDPPPKEAVNFWYFFNRYAEHVARWARMFGFLVLCLGLIDPAKAVDNGQWGDKPQWVRDWYQAAELTDAARQRLGVAWKSCCEHSDVFRTQFRVNKDNGEDEWYYLADNTWKRVPPDIIHWGESAPDGQPTLFIWQGIETCFWAGTGGG